MKNRNVVIFVIFLFLLVILAAYVRYLYLDYKNSEYGKDFPSPARGQEYITESPIVTQENAGIIKINWSISKRCNYNEIEVQEENYRSSKNSYWGGDTAVCEEINGVYHCEIIPSNLVSGKKYFAQIRSVFCDDDTGIIGPVFYFVKK